VAGPSDLRRSRRRSRLGHLGRGRPGRLRRSRNGRGAGHGGRPALTAPSAVPAFPVSSSRGHRRTTTNMMSATSSQIGLLRTNTSAMPSTRAICPCSFRSAFEDRRTGSRSPTTAPSSTRMASSSFKPRWRTSPAPTSPGTTAGGPPSGPGVPWPDDGLSFGTNRDAGVCVHFAEKGSVTAESPRALGADRHRGRPRRAHAGARRRPGGAARALTRARLSRLG